VFGDHPPSEQNRSPCILSTTITTIKVGDENSLGTTSKYARLVGYD